MNHGQKEYYKRDYAAAKKAGKPFFPYAVYKDLLIASLAIGLVMVLAIWQRVEVGEPVNPATTDFVPRPEWYFFFLFELLKIFEGENALTPVIMATFIIPNILMILLILTPFIDQGPERRIQRRPIAVITSIVVIAFLGYMTYLGAEAPEGVGAGTTLPLSGLEEDPVALAGSELWLENCTACHQIAGVGATGPGPELSNFGSTGTITDAASAEQFLKNPPSGMPAFASFTPEQYEQMGAFLSGLGTKYN